jgi:hypothetical protein
MILIYEINSNIGTLYHNVLLCRDCCCLVHPSAPAPALRPGSPPSCPASRPDFEYLNFLQRRVEKTIMISMLCKHHVVIIPGLVCYVVIGWRGEAGRCWEREGRCGGGR